MATLRSILSGPHSRDPIAISHVWADGLVHPELSSLPQCQLHYLLKALRICQQKELEDWIGGPPDTHLTDGCSGISQDTDFPSTCGLILVVFPSNTAKTIYAAWPWIGLH